MARRIGAALARRAVRRQSIDGGGGVAAAGRPAARDAAGQAANSKETAMSTKKHPTHNEPGLPREQTNEISSYAGTHAAGAPLVPPSGANPTPTPTPTAPPPPSPEQIHITGRVVDVDCHPIHNMAISASPEDAGAPFDARQPATHTGADGCFTLIVPRGTRTNVRFPGRHEQDGRVLVSARTDVFCQPHRNTDLGELIYQPTHSSVSGSVQYMTAAGSASLAPLGGVPIDLVDARGNTIAATQTGDDGRYTFNIRHGGMFGINAPSDWSASQGLLTQSGGQPPLRFYRSPEDPLTLPPITYELAPTTITGQVTDGQRGISGITVTLEATGRRAVTDKSGVYRFEGVTPGTYNVLFPATTTDPSGEGWELPAGQPAKASVTATGGQVATVAAVAYTQEPHVIEWKVLGTDNAAAADVIVELCTPDGRRALQQQLTDATGTATFELTSGGDFLVRVHGDPPAAPLETAVSCNSKVSGVSRAIIKRPSTSSTKSTGSQPAAAPEALIDMAAYPILTEDVSQGGAVAPSRTGADASVGLTASTAISSVLGCRTNPDDPNPTAFLAALKNVFDLKEVEGHVEWTYNQTSSYSVDADLGAITGAQASILKRAQTMIDESCRILPLIQALRPDADPTDCASILSIIVDELQQIPDALSLPSGPIVEQIDELFRRLGAESAAQSTVPLEGLSGQLQEFRDRYGMERHWVNNVQQEQTLTDFITVVDYITDLYKSWRSNRDFFSGIGGEPPFLGTQLVTLSRLLSVIGDKVNQVRYVMESLFIPRSELATIHLKFGTKRAPMYFDDLLTWIEKSSTDAASQMRLNGKDAVMTYARTAKLLTSLVGDCYYQKQITYGNTDVPKAFSAPRAARAIKELGDQLDEIQRQARQVNRKPDPRVKTVIPTPMVATGGAALSNTTLTLQLYGSGFQSGATVSLIPAGGGAAAAAAAGVRSGTANLVNSTFMTVSVPFPLITKSTLPTARPWKILVVNPDEGTWESAPGQEVMA